MFARCHPDIEIAVEAATRPVDLRREPIDLAIRHGLGKYPGLEATWLVAPELIVVASPDGLKNRAPLKRPGDCLAFPLLHDFNRQDWPLWFEAHGIAAPDCRKGPSFSENHLILRAAVAGQGLALVRDIFVDDDLRSKTLVKALTMNWLVQFAYYAVATSEALQRFDGFGIGWSKRREREEAGVDRAVGTLGPHDCPLLENGRYRQGRPPAPRRPS